eukprot:m.220487 g.220487  ORF g.220487 m.220487 type:complete len:283 (+) comp39944_c0_seq2:93-941(+)
MQSFLLVVVLTFGSALAQTTPIDVPVELVTEKLIRPAAMEVNYYNGTICAHQQSVYDGYMAYVSFDLPFNLDWSLDLGIVYGVVSDKSDFSTVLCANYMSGSVEVTKICNFTYTKELGQNIYFRVNASNAPGIQYTFGMEFVKPAAQRLTRYTDMTIEQPMAATFEPLRPIIRLSDAGTVITTKSVDYQFGVCATDYTGSNFNVELTVYGVTPRDAMSTYACSTTPCTTENAIVNDISASSINDLVVHSSAVIQEGIMYLHIVGYGGLGESEFELGSVFKSA